MNATRGPEDDCHDDGALTETQRTLAKRMTDPGLTEHDRLVLRRFSEFLAGLARDEARPIGQRERPLRRASESQPGPDG